MSPGVEFAAEVTKTSTGEAAQFWVLAVIALLGALGTVFFKKAVHSALALALTMICLAIFYLAQGAVFLGIVQIVVYTGAVMMLFLFVLMLVGVSSVDSLKENLRGQRAAAAALGLGFGILLVAGIANASITHFNEIAPAPATPAFPAETDPAALEAAAQGNVQGLAHQLFTRYVWVFEITSALLITAAVGAMVLAHRERITARKSQRELAEERVRGGGQLAPLPTPGVYARHNAVDVPALLPDGAVAEQSVSRVLRARGQVRDVSAEAIQRVAGIEAASADDDDESWPDDPVVPGRAVPGGAASPAVPTARTETEDTETAGGTGGTGGAGDPADTGPGKAGRAPAQTAPNAPNAQAVQAVQPAKAVEATGAGKDTGDSGDAGETGDPPGTDGGNGEDDGNDGGVAAGAGSKEGRS